MSITIEDVAKLHHDNLRTIGSKILYLTILNNANENGWTSISLADLARTTCLSRCGVITALKRMEKIGLIEIQHSDNNPKNRNKYRAITL